MKKLPLVLSLAAILLSASSLYFAYGTHVVLRNTLAETDLRMLAHGVDRLRDDLMAVATVERPDDSTAWSKDDQSWELASKELGARFSIPEYWAAPDEPEVRTPARLTTFANGVSDARKWSFSAGGNAMGFLYPDIEAYHGYYPHDDSVLATLEPTLAPDDAYPMLPDPFNETRFAYEADAAKACAAFEKLVLAHSGCERVDDRAWYVEYATYMDEDEDRGIPGEPWIVGGFMWFVSLDGMESDYNGFTIGYRERERFTGRDMEGSSRAFLDQDVQDLKSTDEFEGLRLGVDRVLETLGPY